MAVRDALGAAVILAREAGRSNPLGEPGKGVLGPEEARIAEEREPAEPAFEEVLRGQAPDARVIAPAVGMRFPRRVVAGGGLFLEYDGRAIPDTVTMVIDYEEGCQIFVTGTMGNTTPLDEVIRGHTGTIKFTPDGFDLLPQMLTGRPGPPIRDEPRPRGARHVATEAPKGNDADTRALWEHFLGCVRSRNPETLCPPELGQAAVVTATMGVQSYREGKALFFDRATGNVSATDPSWVARWEERSRQRGKTDQVLGWRAGDEGSLLHPFDYQRLEGDWIDGVDPAAKVD